MAVKNRVEKCADTTLLIKDDTPYTSQTRWSLGIVNVTINIFNHYNHSNSMRLRQAEIDPETIFIMQESDQDKGYLLRILLRPLRNITMAKPP